MLRYVPTVPSLHPRKRESRRQPHTPVHASFEACCPVDDQVRASAPGPRLVCAWCEPNSLVPPPAHTRQQRRKPSPSSCFLPRAGSDRCTGATRPQSTPSRVHPPNTSRSNQQFRLRHTRVSPGTCTPLAHSTYRNGIGVSRPISNRGISCPARNGIGLCDPVRFTS